MQMSNTFKYIEEIKVLLSQGLELPPLKEPGCKEAFRFVFRNKVDCNHIPPYIQKPQRVISAKDKGELTTSGYALSCLETEIDAIRFYDSLCSYTPLISKHIGDSLSRGHLVNTDGLITSTNHKGHFDLYEYQDCNLSSKFIIYKDL
jgi:hypothetical protein